MTDCHRSKCHKPSTVKYTLVLTAFNSEFNTILSLLSVEKKCTIAGRVVVIGKLDPNGKTPLILTMTGVGPINAALTLQLMIDKFHIERVINIGISGGVNPDTNMCDVIIPSDTCLYQQQLYAKEKSPGNYEIPSFISGAGDYGNFGMIFPTNTEVLVGDIDHVSERMFFNTSDELLCLAKKTFSTLTLKDTITVGDRTITVEHQPEFRYAGRIASGSTYLDNDEYRSWLIGNSMLNSHSTPMHAVDEESAAFNMVCLTNGNIPFLAIRTISDLAGRNTDPDELLAFLPLTLSNMKLSTESFLKGLDTLLEKTTCGSQCSKTEHKCRHHHHRR